MSLLVVAWVGVRIGLIKEAPCRIVDLFCLLTALVLWLIRLILVPMLVICSLVDGFFRGLTRLVWTLWIAGMRWALATVFLLWGLLAALGLVP